MLKQLFLSILLLSFYSLGIAQTNTNVSPIHMAMQLIDQSDYAEAVNSLSYYGFELLSGDGTTAIFQYPDGTIVTYTITDPKADPEMNISTPTKYDDIEKILSSSGFSKVKFPSTGSGQRKTDNVKPTSIYERGTRLHRKSTICLIFKGSPTTLSFNKRFNK